MQDIRPDEAEDMLGKWETQLRKGGLGLAVLAVLWDGRRYGLEILRRLEADAGLAVSEGAIYPLLNRLKTEGLVASEWVEAAAGHPRKYYSLTDVGRARVRDMAASWTSFAAGLERLLAPLKGDPR
ncbi:PadR family transcriptional regulator [Phenylobacterium sp.]|uniref:PadR family transcriptional regulator n=1 Tax=Phenylobacterium sp. TaxID=1871053 RepID=UPI002DE8CA50|nr:PadR family transcriptional regulator [Phenylobacterium sp.]